MSIESRSRQYGEVFDNWHIGKKLGSGSNGQSAVFELYRDNNGWRERSALKVIGLIEERGQKDTMPLFQRDEYSTAAGERRNQAEQEVRLMYQVKGKTNIVGYEDYKFFDWSDESGFGTDLLIRMELLSDLRSLIKNLLKENKRLMEREIIKIGRDICEALVICHGKEILHRDIKPENIFFNEDGDYKLGDFGISRVLGASSLASTGVGTFAYTAPEQRNSRYDIRVDIYSLGLVLYELANGNRLPFARSSYVRSEEIEKRLVGAPLPAPCGASQALADVILKACAFDPEDRFQTAREFQLALSKVDAEQDMACGGAVSAQKMACYETIDSSVRTGKAGAYETVPADKQPGPSYETVPAAGWSDDRSQAYATIPAAPRSGNEYATMPADSSWNPQNYGEKPDESERQKTVAARGGAKHGKGKLIAGIAAVCVVAGLALCLGLGHSEEPEPEETKGTTASTIASPTEDAEYLDAVAYCAELEQQGAYLEVVQYLNEKQDAKYDDLRNAYQQKLRASTLAQVQELTEQGLYRLAILELDEAQAVYPCMEFENTAAQLRIQFARGSVVAAGHAHTAVLNQDGTVSAHGSNEQGQCNISGWTDIVSIGAGDYFTVGLRSDGRVVAVGDNTYGQCNVSGWTNVVAIGVGDYHVIGLCADGTLKATGYSKKGQCDIQSLYDQAAGRQIVELAAGVDHTLALLEDGTVIAVGTDTYGQLQVGSWTDIIAIACGSEHAVGLRSDGTVVATGLGNEGQCDVFGWKDVWKVSVGDYVTMGIKADGSVVCAGVYHITRTEHPAPDMDEWANVADVAGGTGHAVAVTEDGSYLTDGRYSST